MQQHPTTMVILDHIAPPLNISLIELWSKVQKKFSLFFIIYKKNQPVKIVTTYSALLMQLALQALYHF